VRAVQVSRPDEFQIGCAVSADFRGQTSKIAFSFQAMGQLWFPRQKKSPECPPLHLPRRRPRDGRTLTRPQTDECSTAETHERIFQFRMCNKIQPAHEQENPKQTKQFYWKNWVVGVSFQVLEHHSAKKNWIYYKRLPRALSRIVLKKKRARERRFRKSTSHRTGFAGGGCLRGW